jgi:hypothetical protein
LMTGLTDSFKCRSEFSIGRLDLAFAAMSISRFSQCIHKEQMDISTEHLRFLGTSRKDQTDKFVLTPETLRFRD